MPGQLDVVRVATNALTLLPAALDLAADAIGSNWTKNPLNLVPPGFFPSIKRAVYSRIPEWMTFPVNLLPHGPTMVQGDHPNYGGTAPFYVPPALLPLALPMKVLWVSVPGLPSLTNYYMASGDASWVPSGGVKIGPDDFIPDDAVDWTRQSFSSGTPQSDSAAAGLHAAWDRMSPENQTRWWNQEGIYMVWDPDHPRVKAVASLLKAPIKTIGIMGGATFLVANPALAIPAATAVKAVVALGAVGTVLESVPTMVDLSSRQAFPYDEGIRKEILNLPSARERGHAIITKCTESGRCVLPWNKFAASLDRVEACAAARGFNQVAREYRISEFILSLEAGILIVAIDRTRRWRQAARRGANMDSKEVNDAISTGLFVELGMSTALGTFLFALYQVSGVAYGNFPLPGIITASTLGVYAFLLNMKGAPITTEQSSGITPAQITSVQERVATALATMNLKQYSNPANIPHGAIKAIVITAWAVHDILIGTYPVETLLYGVLQFLAVSLLDPVYIGTVFTDRMHPTTVALLTAADAADVLPRPVDSTLTQGPPNPGLSLLLWFHTALGVLNDPKLTWAATLRANPTFDFHQATSSASQHNNIRNAKVWNSDALRTAGAYRDLHPSVHPIFAYFGLAFGSTGVMEARRMFFTNLTTTTNSLNFATWLVEFLTPPAGLSAPLRLEMVVSALAWTVRCAAMVTVLTMDPYEYRGPTYA